MPDRWRRTKASTEAAQPFPVARLTVSDCTLHQTFGYALEFKASVLMSLAASKCGDALHESKMLSGLRFSSPRTTSMIFVVSDLENPPLRRKVSRSSSVRATIRSRAALIPATNWQSTPMLARRFLRKSLRRELRMADRDLLEILDAPEVAVHADRSSAPQASCCPPLCSNNWGRAGRLAQEGWASTS
ncbi:hypothetical protein AB7M56_002373 [Bradyrhizobium elkanii]|nr:hypothetical protein [Bradyrhizobium elkanii]MCS4072123.1 hypothetical protein [Bradyrhizobium elkanii]MCS4078756.1 hypothetical protein [Bradyrhizobium elkanii]MCW2122645.1 hypothetical protein [Bradyrhizobium elkanii]MCW2169392.1 hypothetical protein [Bradyrhizobium elkanii]